MLIWANSAPDWSLNLANNCGKSGDSFMKLWPVSQPDLSLLRCHHWEYGHLHYSSLRRVKMHRKTEDKQILNNSSVKKLLENQPPLLLEEKKRRALLGIRCWYVMKYSTRSQMAIYSFKHHLLSQHIVKQKNSCLSSSIRFVVRWPPSIAVFTLFPPQQVCCFPSQLVCSVWSQESLLEVPALKVWAFSDQCVIPPVQ